MQKLDARDASFESWLLFDLLVDSIFTSSRVLFLRISGLKRCPFHRYGSIIGALLTFASVYNPL